MARVFCDINHHVIRWGLGKNQSSNLSETPSVIIRYKVKVIMGAVVHLFKIIMMVVHQIHILIMMVVHQIHILNGLAFCA